MTPSPSCKTRTLNYATRVPLYFISESIILNSKIQSDINETNKNNFEFIVAKAIQEIERGR